MIKIWLSADTNRHSSFRFQNITETSLDVAKFEEQTNAFLEAWMNKWGSIPNADYFLTDALGECLLEGEFVFRNNIYPRHFR